MINCTISGKIRQLKQVNDNLVTFAIPETRYVKRENITVWHDFTAFGKVAERLSRFAHDGTVVSVAFRIDYKKVDSAGMTYTNFVAEEVEFIDHFGKQEKEGA